MTTRTRASATHAQNQIILLGLCTTLIVTIVHSADPSKQMSLRTSHPNGTTTVWILLALTAFILLIITAVRHRVQHKEVRQPRYYANCQVLAYIGGRWRAATTTLCARTDFTGYMYTVTLVTPLGNDTETDPLIKTFEHVAEASITTMYNPTTRDCQAQPTIASPSDDPPPTLALGWHPNQCAAPPEQIIPMDG